jgi:hypothetical protein
MFQFRKEGAMRLTRIVLLCAASVLLVLASTSYAADAPGGATANATPEATANPAPEATAKSPAEVAANPSPEAAVNPPADAAANPSATTNAAAKPAGQQTMVAPATANNPPTVTSPERIYLIRENPFFGLHIEKAVQHAREAEMAGNLGQSRN